MTIQKVSSELHNQSQQLAFLSELGQLALTSDSLKKLIDTTLHRIGQILKADYYAIFEYNPETQTFLLRAGVGWKKSLLNNARIGDGLDSQAGYTLIINQPVLVEDLSQEQRFHDAFLLNENGIHGGISVIIRGSQYPFGVLSVHSRERRFFSQGDIDFMQSTANILSAFIQRTLREQELRDINLTLESQVEERTELLRLMHDVTLLANETDSVTEAMSVFLNTIRLFTGWQIGHALTISEQDPLKEGDDAAPLLTSSSIWSLDDSRDFSSVQLARKDIHIRYGDSLAGSTWKKGMPIFVEDISNQPIVGREELLKAGLKAALAIPVFTGKQVAAVLEFFFEDESKMTPGLLEVIATAGLKLGRVIERRRSEVQLQDSQMRLREVQRIAHVGSWEWDIGSDAITLSREMYRILDMKVDEFDGTYHSFLNKIHPEDLEWIRNEIERTIDTRTPFRFQHRILRKDGEPRVVQTYGRVTLDEQSHATKMIGTAQDITETVQIENRLLNQEMLLDSVLAQSKVIVWVIDLNGKLQLSRRGGLAALGIVSGDQLGSNVFDVIPQNHSFTKYIHQSLSGAMVAIDYKVGDRIYDLRILPQMDKQGDVIGVSGIAFDITQRIETEKALQESEQRYRMVVDSVKDYAIFSLDVDGHVTSWNEGSKSILGYKAQEIIGKHFSIFFTEEARERGLHQNALQIAGERGRYESEGLRVRKDGSQFWANTILAPIYNEKNELVGYSKVVRDFTQRQEARQALEESEKRFRSIFEFGAMGIALLDEQGDFLLTNHSLQKMFGYDKQEMLSHGLMSLVYPSDFPLLIEMYAENYSGKYNLFRRESRFQKKDGQILWVSLTFSLVRDAKDSPAYVIGMFEDITYRKRMEAELREIKRQLITSQEAQKLHLAQELHDDPMQDLYGVIFQFESLDNSSPREELQAQIKIAKDSIEHVIQKLRNMCGQLRPLSLAPFGLEGAIRDHIEKFREEHPDLKIKLELTYDGQILSEEIRISLFRIYQQALGNVIRHSQANLMIVRFNYNDQEAVLEVEDDGIGFEVPPSWFRLAQQDHLGLAGAAERAELLNGKLIIQSKLGKGTLVRAIIPIQSPQDPAFNQP